VHGRSWLVERFVWSIPLTNETSTPQIVLFIFPLTKSGWLFKVNIIVFCWLVMFEIYWYFGINILGYNRFNGEWLY